MYIDQFYKNVKLSKVSPKMKYEDGKATQIQQTDENGTPIWTLLCAVPDGDFVEPVRVKLASKVEVEPQRNIRFTGLQVNAYGRSSDLFYAADSFEYVDEDASEEERLTDLLGDE